MQRKITPKNLPTFFANSKIVPVIIVIKSIIIISNFKRFSGATNLLDPEEIADAPIMPKQLKIFEPIILPIAISEYPFLTATTDAAISGKDVPRAIIVRPMNTSGTNRDTAIFFDDQTTNSADPSNNMTPKKTRSNPYTSFSFFFVALASLFVTTPFFLEKET